MVFIGANLCYFHELTKFCIVFFAFEDSFLAFTMNLAHFWNKKFGTNSNILYLCTNHKPSNTHSHEKRSI